ncbi:hypothetical protein [Chitinolyticbacter meiyuanensis]|uniref:hypothetical protein n=1 Tax=Chitinolyticbacter meiyuanensis TaxID=682798 RepID=UPI0011E5BED6|nr:hypothetical protein [Chitinolyticbacter meiyuanensis]
MKPKLKGDVLAHNLKVAAIAVVTTLLQLMVLVGTIKYGIANEAFATTMAYYLATLVVLVCIYLIQIAWLTSLAARAPLSARIKWSYRYGHARAMGFTRLASAFVATRDYWMGA